MTEFTTRANYEGKNFEIIIKTDREAHYKLVETFSRALIDDCGYEKRDKEIVRCKDCKKQNECGLYLDIEPEWFCADGERRESE